MLGFITTYGNGYKKVYIPKNENNENPSSYVPLTGEEREEENRRLRCVKTRQNIMQRGMSTNSYEFFSTLTTDNENLALNPKELLKKGKKFILNEIKKYNYLNENYILVLEAFEKEDRGFHLHCLSDFPLDLDEWEGLCGANKERRKKTIFFDLDENFEEEYYKKGGKNRHLYCEKLLFLQRAEENGHQIDDDYRNFATFIPLRYMTKKVDITKERMEKLYPHQRITMYSSNVKKIKKNTEEFVYDEDNLEFFDNFNEDYLDFINKIKSNFEEFKEIEEFEEFEEGNSSKNDSKNDDNQKILEKIQKLNDEVVYNNYLIIEKQNFIKEMLEENLNFDTTNILIAINSLEKDIKEIKEKIILLISKNNIQYTLNDRFNYEKIKEINYEIIVYYHNIKDLDNLIKEILIDNSNYNIDGFLQAINGFKQDISNMNKKIDNLKT